MGPGLSMVKEVRLIFLNYRSDKSQIKSIQTCRHYCNILSKDSEILNECSEFYARLYSTSVKKNAIILKLR